jgi:hypothetical protein
MMMLMTKKFEEGPKNDEKTTLSGTHKNDQKWSPARAARNHGAEESKGGFGAWSRGVELVRCLEKKKKKKKKKTLPGMARRVRA